MRGGHRAVAVTQAWGKPRPDLAKRSIAVPFVGAALPSGVPVLVFSAALASRTETRLRDPTHRCYIGLPHAIEPAVPIEREFERRSLLIPRKTWPPKPGCPGTDQHLWRRADWLLACVGAILLGSLSLSAQSVALQVESALRKGKQAQEAGDFVAAGQSLEQARRLAPEKQGGVVRASRELLAGKKTGGGFGRWRGSRQPLAPGRAIPPGWG